MIKTFNRLSHDKKRLLENFFSLSILQGANYILPLITLPYLVRVLGPEKFGLIMFAQAFIMYFNILTDYGFNLSATREIAIHRDNKEKISEIFSSVMIIKLGLLITSFIITSVIVFSFEKFRKDWIIYYLTFGMIIGQALFPVWFFQGMEKMKYITFLNIITKLIFTVSIFVFIHKVSDYIYVPLLNSLGFTVAGILALWIVFRNFGIYFKIPSLGLIKYLLKEGWYIFLSTIVVSFYRVLPTSFLGIFDSYKSVGYYSVAEKIIRSIVGLFQPVTQSIFPYVARKMSYSAEKGVKFAFKTLKLLSIFTLFISIIVLIFSGQIVSILAGEEYKKSSTILEILSPLPFVIGIANIFGVQIMLNTGLKKQFSRILMFGGVLSIILNLCLIPISGIIGAAISVLISETAVMILMVVTVSKHLKTTSFKKVEK